MTTVTRIIREVFEDWKQAIAQVFDKRCVFCQQHADEVLKCVARRNSYEERIYHYHQACLLAVMQDPEAHDHMKVDLVLDIHDCITRREQERRLKEGWCQMKLDRIMRLKKAGLVKPQEEEAIK